MATTMTGSGELLYASFPVDKMETNEDGDLVVYGKASDGQVDSDNQIVDPTWMGKAVQDWMSSGPNIRTQHNPQLYPAGKGLQAETDRDGNTFVRGLIVEPNAKELVAKGVLRAYSVGIARPSIVRDAAAPGGRIVGGELVEISLVDRPANKRCGIQLVKSVDGAPEFVNEVFGSEEDIAKALTGEIFKTSTGVTYENGTSATGITMTDDITFTFTPNDLAKILKTKFIEQHYDELAMKAILDAEAGVYKRDIDTATRRSLASAGHALPDGSYPIANSEDLHNAAVLARSGHGNVSGAKALIARRAKDLGVANPLDSDNEKNIIPDTTVVAETETPKEAEPVVTKDPADGDGPGPKDKKKPKKGAKNLPPWLNQNKAADSADGDDGEDEDDDGSDSESCKMDHAHTEKCMPSGTPQSASGAKDAASMDEIPNPGAYQHSPMPAGRNTPEHKSDNPEVAALLRFKTIGIDPDLGRLHDLTCPAFSPDDVAKYHPFADFNSVIEPGVWQRKAVDAACGPLEKAMMMTEIWQASEVLKNADEAELNTHRMEMHKAFRDANPGPTSYPSPGSIGPKSFCRPNITAGHSANSSGYGSPNSSPQVADSAPMSGNNFDRPPLSSGHQSPSPSFMKATWETPSAEGVPQRLQFAHLEKERARVALSMMHDHLAHAFPLACPMIEQDAYTVNNPTTNVPPTEGLSKSEETPVVETTVAINVDADTLYKGMRKKLGKKVLSGKMTVDEARSKMGRMRAQKADDDNEALIKSQFESGKITRDEALKALGFETPETVTKSVAVSVPVAPMFDADVIKSAVESAFGPLLAKLQATEEKLEKAEKRLEKFDEYDERFEKLANVADPSSVVFTGLAMNPVRKSANPVGVPSQAEIAERTQQMMMRQLQRTANASENPAEREAAWQALYKMQGMTE
jgi:hypothetical protein